MNDRSNFQWRSAALQIVMGIVGLLLVESRLQAQSVTPIWNFPSETFPAGQEVRSVSSVNVGTDGSVAVTLTTDDGSFGNTQYKLYWIAPDGTLAWASPFLAEPIEGNGPFPVALTIRPGLLIYQEGDTVLKSVVKVGSNPGVVSTIATADGANDNTFAAYSLEQSRTPGVFAIVEVEGDGTGFTVRAFRMNASVQNVTLVGSETGVQGGQYVLQFSSQAGVTYQIQSSTDLQNWTDQGPVIVGDGGIKSLLEPVNGTTHKFFRVVLQ